MPLVSSKEILQKAMSEGYAVGAFNANNAEMVQAIVETAQEEQAPVILQISQGAIRMIGKIVDSPALETPMIRITAAIFPPSGSNS